MVVGVAAGLLRVAPGHRHGRSTRMAWVVWPPRSPVDCLLDQPSWVTGVAHGVASRSGVLAAPEVSDGAGSWGHAAPPIGSVCER